MKEMMEETKWSMAKIQSGDIVKGKVISVTDSEVFVNIGYIADGIITKEEFSDDDSVSPKDCLNVGDEISVYVMETNDGEGNVALSKKKADSEKVWDEFEDSLKNGITFEVKIKEVVKGGVLAFVKGVRAFIPASQISASYVENLNDYLGKTLLVKVLELDREKKNVVLSRKEVEKAEGEIKKEEVWSTLEKGQKGNGVVRRLAKFGAFVDIGGVDGLIHISDLSWKRVNDPSEVVSVGDSVEVYVLDFNKEKNRISLDLRDVSKNPWLSVEEKFKIGDTLEGTVVNLLDFGAFVQIESGVEGLVHISQISDEHISKPSAVLNIGDKVKVKILEINKKDHKMSLSIERSS